MITRFRAALLVSLSLVLAAGPAGAARFTGAVTVPDNAVLLMSVDMSREETQSGKTTVTRMRARYREALTRLPTGFRITRTLVDKQLDGLPSVDWMLMFVDQLVFQADATLEPSSIEDWPGVLTRAVATFPAAPEDRALLSDSAATFAKAPSEQVARNLLQYDNLLSIMQGRGLVLGKPETYVNQAPNPWGGSPIDVDGTMTLESVDARAGVAVALMRETMDPESARAAVVQIVADMRARGVPITSLPAGLRVERTTSCRFEMDLATGLARRAECDTTTFIGDDDPKDSLRRVDHRVVTRTLEAAS